MNAQIGVTTISYQNNHFAHGYKAGHARFIASYKGKPITAMDVYSFIFSSIMHVGYSSTYAAGYVLGWFDALRGCEANLPLIVESEDRQP